MEHDYSVGTLRPGLAVPAYALVQAVAPSFAATDWEAVVNATERWRCVVIEDCAGYVRGLSVFSVRRHPTGGMLMDIPFFVIGSAVNDSEIAERLFANLRTRAAGCQFMRFWSSPPGNMDALEDEALFRRWDHGLMYRLDSRLMPALL
jgi:hypothetical protein